MASNQVTYHQKVEELVKDKAELGTNVYERPAVDWLVGELRKLADHIESQKYPMVMDATIPKDGIATKEAILEFRVTLSHPWGG